MEKFTIELSQNDWEYTGYLIISCNDSVEQVDERVLLVDGTIKLEFEEDVKISDDNSWEE